MSAKAILQTIIAALEPLKTTAGVKTIRAYGGELAKLESGKEPPALAPAILGGLHQDSMEYVDQITDTRRMRFVFFLLTADADRGVKRAESMADLLDAFRGALHNQTLGMTLTAPIRVAEFEIIADSPLFLGAAVSVEIETLEQTGA
ncbi:MAG: hypothetical protein HZB29_09800 [Nitrospinae bacterium]|nr:hypothetical protein [Nitrospinota bacterium]